MRTYEQAWADALYGEGGFFVLGHGAGRDFRTSATSHPAVLAEVLAELIARLHHQLGGTLDVVDVGAADGSLLAAVADASTVPVRPLAVEVGDPWPAQVRGLLMAHEWLDDVPCPVVRSGRTVLEDFSLGDPAPPGQLAWLARWWPPSPAVVGQPLSRGGSSADHDQEVGTTRDAAWADAVLRVTAGAALAVDYEARSPSTLTGFKGGREVAPLLDGSTDITSHVVLTACAEAAGAPYVLTTQRAVVAPFGQGDDRDAAAYLHRLAAGSARADLRRSPGLGDFGWLLHGRGGVDPVTLLGF